jgi:hypothetical protein
MTEQNPIVQSLRSALIVRKSIQTVCGK